MQKTLLVIDDDEKLNALLSNYFKQFGFTVHSCVLPSAGLKHLRQHKPDLVILDVMLPEMDGFEVCKKIRQEFKVPIIMLTARGEVMDRILGLELGADDYLPKPFEPRELVARIQSVLRRGIPDADKAEVVRFGELEVHLSRREARLQGELLDLTTMEFTALEMFLGSQGKALHRDEILENLRGIEWDAFNRSVDVLISRLRLKLKDDPKRPRYLKTVWGIGYQFIASSTDP